MKGIKAVVALGCLLGCWFVPGESSSERNMPSDNLSSMRPAQSGLSALKKGNLAGSSGSASSTGVSTRIVGGTKVDNDQVYPYFASLWRSCGSGNVCNFCGGALINEKFVLTAAHCTGSTVEVCIDDFNVLSSSDGEECIRVVREIIHPEYNAFTFLNDIALLELESASTKPVVKLAENNPKQGDDVMVIGMGALWDMGPRPAQGEVGDFFPCSECNVACKNDFLCRWGTGSCATTKCYDDADPYEGDEFDDDRFGPFTAANLREVQVPMRNENICAQSFLPAGSYQASVQICAGGNQEKDSCSGDSGGPLLNLDGAVPEVIGVVSYGISCGLNGFPGVYTRVSAYQEFIQESMDPDNSALIIGIVIGVLLFVGTCTLVGMKWRQMKQEQEQNQQQKRVPVASPAPEI